MKKSSIKALLFIILFLAGITLLCRVNSEENNNIEVYNIPLKKLPASHNFVGINWADFSKNYTSILFSTKLRDDFAQSMRLMGLDLIRYPGGMNVLRSFWDVPDKEIAVAVGKIEGKYPVNTGKTNSSTSTSTDFEKFMVFCKEAGLKAEIQVNIHNYFDKEKNEILPLKEYPVNFSKNRVISEGKINWDIVSRAAKNAAAQVKWVKNNEYSDTVQYWELGNEDYSIDQFLNSGYSANEYTRVVSIFLREMIAASPSIRIILTNYVNPETNDLNVWSKEVLNSSDIQKYKNNIYAVSNHVYPWGNTEKNKSFEAFKNNILNNQDFSLERRINFHNNLIKNSRLSNLKIFVNEFNSGYFLNPYVHTWLGAIGDAQMIFSCANSISCDHADFHELIMNWCEGSDTYVNKGFGLLHYAKDFQIPFVIQPEGYVISLLNENIKGDILKTISNNPDIYATSSVDRDYIRILLLNKGKDHSINTKLNGFTNLKYIGNKSLGIGVPERFTVINTGELCSNPSEVKQLNILDNAVDLNNCSGMYRISLPKNSLIVLIFRQKVNP